MCYGVREMSVLIRKDGEKSREYDYIGTFSDDDIAPVYLWEEGYGYITIDLDEICELKYDDATHFINGFGCVKLNGKYGFVDTNGYEICPIKYDKVWAFSSDGIALVEKQGKYGFINEEGEEVCNVKYDIGRYKGGSIEDRFEGFHPYYGFNFMGLVIIKEYGKYGIVNSKGQVIIEPKYDDIILPYDSKVSDGNLIPYASNHKMGYIDCNGKVVMPADYYDIVDTFSNGFARVSIGNMYGYIDTDFRKICELEYISTYPFSESGYAVVKKCVHMGPFNIFIGGYINREGRFSVRMH